MKRSIVKTLVERAEKIPSTSARRDGGKKHVLSCDSFRRASGLSDYPGMSDELKLNVQMISLFLLRGTNELYLKRKPGNIIVMNSAAMFVFLYEVSILTL